MGVMSPALWLLVLAKHRVDDIERRVDLLADLCAGEDNLPRDKNEQDDFRFKHAINKSREKLGLIARELSVPIVKSLQTNGELDIARTDNVLNLELGKLCVKPELLDDACVFARSETRVVFRFGTRDDHFSRRKDERRRFRFADTHDHSGKTLWIVLCITGVHCNRLQIETCPEIDGSYDILEGWDDPFYICDILLF